MSSSHAIIHCQDGTTFYGRYDGTVDVLRPFLYTDPHERDAVFQLRGVDEPRFREEPCACSKVTWTLAWVDTDYADVHYPLLICKEHLLVRRAWQEYPLAYDGRPFAVPWEPAWAEVPGPGDYREAC